MKLKSILRNSTTGLSAENAKQTAARNRCGGMTTRNF